MWISSELSQITCYRGSVTGILTQRPYKLFELRYFTQASSANGSRNVDNDFSFMAFAMKAGGLVAQIFLQQTRMYIPHLIEGLF
jgi:hypothetical protein